VISLYAKGLTTGDIQQHLLEIYGTEVSRETISKIAGALGFLLAVRIRETLEESH
jgi:putative transposase